MASRSVIIEGVPAGLRFRRTTSQSTCGRQGGYGRGRRQKIEQDRAEIISGVRHGKTLGSPIALSIQNRDWANWTEQMSIDPIESEVQKVTRLRPGHADLAGIVKYDFDDVRNVLERASARETAHARVGAVCKRLLEELGMEFRSHTVQIGAIEAPVPPEIDWNAVEESPVRCADAAGAEKMVAAIDEARNAGDTLGGIVEGRVMHAPMGLGSHVHWDRKIDGLLAQALMSIHSVKGVEIGAGFAATRTTGSHVHDVILPLGQWRPDQPWARATNNAGGTEGGITDGQDIVVRIALKPIATLPRALPSADLMTGEEIPAHYERSDICVVPAAGIIVEAMCAIVLATAALEKFGGDSLGEMLRNWRGFEATIGPRALRE
jgi:chorismate synthase